MCGSQRVSWQQRKIGTNWSILLEGRTILWVGDRQQTILFKHLKLLTKKRCWVRLWAKIEQFTSTEQLKLTALEALWFRKLGMKLWQIRPPKIHKERKMNGIKILDLSILNYYHVKIFYILFKYRHEVSKVLLFFKVVSHAHLGCIYLIKIH